jgi:DNA-binding transcriptional MerR regulator
VTTKNYFSIGEVLGLLLEEFPDVTISKIRFLESQGLIEPERTPSGYRKFSQSEVDRLRFILREQKENYLPLKVIRTRLDSDTSDGMVRPYDETSPGVRNPAGHPRKTTPPR